MSEDKRIPGLDGLRAFSILLVIVHHLLFVTTPSGDHRSLFPAGGQGVTIFFVISGFLITHLLCEEEKRNGGISLRGFYFRRAFRILPPAMLYLLLTAGFSSRTDLLNSLFFIRNFFPYGAANGHFWSLSVEEQFYLFWPAIFILLRSNRVRLFCLAAVVAVLPFVRQFAGHILGDQPRTLRGYPVPHAAAVVIFILAMGQLPVLCGCLLAVARQHVRSRLRFATHPLAIYAYIALAAVLLSRDMSWCATILMFVLIVNWAVSQKRSFLDWKPLVWIGVLSYSLYLWQQIFCLQSPLPIVGRFPLNVVASFAAAALSYYFVERPALRLRDRLKRQIRTLAMDRPAVVPR